MTDESDASAGGEGRLPDGLELVRTTPVFDERSVPPGLLSAHRVAPGVWGRLVVRSGRLGFVFEDEPGEVIVVDADADAGAPDADADARAPADAGAHIVIPPGRLHHLELDGPVSFVVEFHKRP